MVRLCLKAPDWAQSRQGQHQSLGPSGKALWDWGSLIWTVKERMYLDQGRHSCSRGREGEWIWYGRGLAEINWAAAEESTQMNIRQTDGVPWLVELARRVMGWMTSSDFCYWWSGGASGLMWKADLEYVGIIKSGGHQPHKSWRGCQVCGGNDVSFEN